MNETRERCLVLGAKRQRDGCECPLRARSSKSLLESLVVKLSSLRLCVKFFFFKPRATSPHRLQPQTRRSHFPRKRGQTSELLS